MHHYCPIFFFLNWDLCLWLRVLNYWWTCLFKFKRKTIWFLSKLSCFVIPNYLKLSTSIISCRNKSMRKDRSPSNMSRKSAGSRDKRALSPPRKSASSLKVTARKKSPSPSHRRHGTPTNSSKSKPSTSKSTCKHSSYHIHWVPTLLYLSIQFFYGYFKSFLYNLFRI